MCFHLKQTKFSNPHGLSDKGNKSTAHDIAFLAFHALKDPMFAKIVSCQKYECITYLTKLNSMDSTAPNTPNKMVEEIQQETPYKMTWLNSNKLL